MTKRQRRNFVRTFFTSPAAVEGDDTAKLLRKAIQLRGMNAPDVWVPDNEDATAPSMRDEGVENIIEVVSEYGADFPGEIHPRVVWHRDEPTTRHQGFKHLLRLADTSLGAIDHLDGFVIPEVGSLEDWKKADECFTLVEAENGLEEGHLAMSVIVESAVAELALSNLRGVIGNPSNNLERLFLLVDGEVDYTKDMRAMTPTGEIPSWPELRHNTSRGASAVGLVAVDGPYDNIRDLQGYRGRLVDNQAKGMLGTWSLTPGQVVEGNKAPLPPKNDNYLIVIDGQQNELVERDDGTFVYEGDDIALNELEGNRYSLRFGSEERDLDIDQLETTLWDNVEYVQGLSHIVDSIEEFEAAKEAGSGAISIRRMFTFIVDDVEIDLHHDRMWDEATYQAALTPITLLQEVYQSRPDQREELEEMYGETVIDRTLDVG